MNDCLQSLWEMQTLDQRKEKLLAEKNAIATSEVQSIWMEMSGIIKQIDISLAKSSVVLQEINMFETELSMLSQQADRLAKDLYSGEIKHIKELEQTTAKHEEAKASIRCCEDKLLNALDAYETIQNNIDARQKELALKRHLHSAKQHEISKAVSGINNAIEDITKRYDQLSSGIAPAVLQKYLELGRRTKPPLAKVNNGICSGCHRSVPVSQIVKITELITYCDNCGRILLP